MQVVVAGASVDKVDLPPQLNGNVIAIACGYNFSVALTLDGRVCAWGSDSLQGQLGVIAKTAGMSNENGFVLTIIFEFTPKHLNELNNEPTTYMLLKNVLKKILLFQPPRAPL